MHMQIYKKIVGPVFEKKYFEISGIFIDFDEISKNFSVIFSKTETCNFFIIFMQLL